MPRPTARQRALRELRRELKTRLNVAATRELTVEIDIAGDDTEDELDEIYTAEYERVLSSRYYDRPVSYRKRADRWKKLLHDVEHLNETEFLANFRLHRNSFWRLVDLVKDDPVFRSRGTKPLRGGADLHMMVLLKFLGSSGNDNTGIKEGYFLGLGSGTVRNYLIRATVAILKLEHRTITWPDANERKDIARRVQAKWDFVNCVGMVDGTLLPLATRPIHNGEDYYSRKASYAVNAMVVCDDVARIRKLVVGWPGSVHDNRVWSNTSLCQFPDSHFSAREYLLGDSAYQVSRFMIPAFKKPPKAELSEEKSYFNVKLAKARIKTEHCIGLLKTRFQYLKEIRVQIGKERRHMRRLIRYVTAASVLHNLLISEPVPAEWEDEITRNGRTIEQLDAEDELNTPIPLDAAADSRREQLLCYLLELRH